MSCCTDKMEYKKYQPKWDCESKADMCCDMDEDMDACDMDYGNPMKKGYCMPKPGYMPYDKMDHMHHMHQGCMGHMPADCGCGMPLPKCEKTCVKTFKCTYKLYKICCYRLYKVCSRCGHEYDYYKHPTCTKCR